MMAAKSSTAILMVGGRLVASSLEGPWAVGSEEALGHGAQAAAGRSDNELLCFGSCRVVDGAGGAFTGEMLPLGECREGRRGSQAGRLLIPWLPSPSAAADPRITDFDTLLQNVADLKAGRPAQVGVVVVAWPGRQCGAVSTAVGALTAGRQGAWLLPMQPAPP